MSGARRQLTVATLVTTAVAFAACASSESTTSDTSETTDTTEISADTGSADTVSADDTVLTLVAYESFPSADTSLNDALDEFSATTGIGVEILIAGDAGTMLSKAALTVGNPEGDVMFGVDNTNLSRALDDDIFEPPVSVVGADLPAEFTELAPDGIAVPIDYGDVCINYDIAWFADAGINPPSSLDDLVDEQYRDLLVVENPATSSPGLAFMLATIDEYGDDGWHDYWTQLTANGVLVVDGWTDAYYGDFTWAGGGDRPLVVSYGSSPPAEVIFADPPRSDAPTGVVEATCFRQIEFAGVLAGTDHAGEATQLLEFLVSQRFQSELALNLFVYPTQPDVELPAEFVEFAVIPDSSRTIEPARIAAHRAEWIDEWTSLVLG